VTGHHRKGRPTRAAFVVAGPALSSFAAGGGPAAVVALAVACGSAVAFAFACFLSPTPKTLSFRPERFTAPP
jgi:hypothetical protein